MAAISGIGMEALDGVAEELLHGWDVLGERVAVVRIAGQRLRMDSKLAALGVPEGGGDADLDAEFIGLVRLALADAFDLGGVLRATLRWAAAFAAVPFFTTASRRLLNSATHGTGGADCPGHGSIWACA